MIDRQVKHLVRLIDDLLDVARISRGMIKLKLDAVDVAYVVSTAVESVRPIDDQGRARAARRPPRRAL